MSAVSPSPQPAGIRDLLARPDFRSLWISQLVSVFGDFVALYAVIAVVSFQMHGTPREVTLIMVFFLMPFALIGPIAGVFVDRWDARRTMIVSDLVRAVLILGLVLAHVPAHVYAVIFAVSMFSSFFVPAQSVVLPQIVGMESLLAANAAMQQAFQLVRIASPAISGALVGYAGSNLCYYLDSATFFVSAWMISRIAVPPRPPHENKHMDSVLGDLFSGMRFIFTHPVMAFVILSLAAGTFAISAFGSLTAIYVRDILHSGTYMFGALGSLIGAGMLIGSFVIAKYGRTIANQALLIVAGLLACGVNIGIIAFAGNTIVTILCCFGIGLSSSMLIIPSMTMMQGHVPPDMRGRVSSSSMSVVTLAQGIAMLGAGDLASRFGIVAVYYGSGLMLLLIALTGLGHLRRKA